MSRGFDGGAGAAYAVTGLVAAPFMLVGAIIASPFILAAHAFSHHSNSHTSHGSHFGFLRGNNDFYASQMPSHHMGFTSQRFGRF